MKTFWLHTSFMNRSWCPTVSLLLHTSCVSACCVSSSLTLSSGQSRCKSLSAVSVGLSGCVQSPPGVPVFTWRLLSPVGRGVSPQSSVLTNSGLACSFCCCNNNNCCKYWFVISCFHSCPMYGSVSVEDRLLLYVWRPFSCEKVQSQAN